jgi:hypothetical protein
MGRPRIAEFPINLDHPSAWPSSRDVTPDHPRWCCRELCTAFESEAEVDRRYHRSKPYVVETDDPHVVLAAHLGANRDGGEQYVEIAELETPLTVPFWVAEPAEGRMLVLRLDQVDAFRHILTSMSRAVR